MLLVTNLLTIVDLRYIHDLWIICIILIIENTKLCFRQYIFIQM